MDATSQPVTHQDRLEIRAKPLHLAALLIGLCASSGLCAASLFPVGPQWLYSTVPPFIAWLCLGVILLCVLPLSLQLLRSGSPVLVLGPEGFQDRRLMTAPLPWRYVTGLGIRQVQSRHYLAITVDPSVLDGHTWTPTGKLRRRIASLHAKNQLELTMYGVDMSAQRLQHTMQAFAAAHGVRPVVMRATSRAA